MALHHSTGLICGLFDRSHGVCKIDQFDHDQLVRTYYLSPRQRDEQIAAAKQKEALKARIAKMSESERQQLIQQLMKG